MAQREAYDDEIEQLTEGLVEICREVLRVELAADDRLPDLGARSILIVDIALGVQRRFGADVPLELFLGGTVRSIAEAIAGARLGATPG
jgi:acyl carrier protein